MAHEPLIPSDQDRFAFGLTTVEVERLRRILSRCGGREVSLEEAWGRASELLALAHTMMEVLATAAPSADKMPFKVTHSNNGANLPRNL